MTMTRTRSRRRKRTRRATKMTRRRKRGRRTLGREELLTITCRCLRLHLAPPPLLLSLPS
jgi:hypothetical protein